MSERRARGCLLAGLVFSMAAGARAETVCDAYLRTSPDLYRAFCNGKAASSKPAGANSTFSDSFNLQAASLPTEPSSYGLETILTTLPPQGTNGPSHGLTFSLIKGFHKFGTGISTGSNNTFYGNDVYERLYGPSKVDSLSPSEPAKGIGTNLNVGTSFSILDSPRGASLKFGLSARYNQITDSIGGGPGLMFSVQSWTFGAGYTRERVSSFLPMITFGNFMVSKRISILEFEYDYLRNMDGPVLDPIQILTATAYIHRLTLTAAVRKLNYIQEGSVMQEHFAFQYLFSKWFSAGFLINYIPGTSSIGTQFYL